jgi:hypothetical protein
MADPLRAPLAPPRLANCGFGRSPLTGGAEGLFAVCGRLSPVGDDSKHSLSERDEAPVAWASPPKRNSGS